MVAAMGTPIMAVENGYVWSPNWHWAGGHGVYVRGDSGDGRFRLRRECASRLSYRKGHLPRATGNRRDNLLRPQQRIAGHGRTARRRLVPAGHARTG